MDNISIEDDIGLKEVSFHEKENPKTLVWFVRNFKSENNSAIFSIFKPLNEPSYDVLEISLCDFYSPEWEKIWMESV